MGKEGVYNQERNTVTFGDSEYDCINLSGNTVITSNGSNYYCISNLIEKLIFTFFCNEEGNDIYVLYDGKSTNLKLLPNGVGHFDRYELKFINSRCYLNDQEVFVNDCTPEELKKIRETVKSTTTTTTTTTTTVTFKISTNTLKNSKCTIVYCFESSYVAIFWNNKYINQRIPSDGNILIDEIVLKFINGNFFYEDRKLISNNVKNTDFLTVCDAIKSSLSGSSSNQGTNETTNNTSSNQTSTNTTETSTSITNISLTCNQFDLDKIIICMVKNCKICIRFNDNCIVQDMESENCEIALPNGFVLKIINGKCIYNSHDLVATMVTKEQFDQVSEQLKNLSIDTLTNGTSSNQTSTNTTETSTSITNISLTCNQFDLDKIIICMVKNCKICIRFNDNCIVQDMESENCEIALPNGFVLKIINGKCIYNSHDLVATMVTKEQFDQVSEQLKNLSIDTLTNGASSNQTSTNTTETSTSITNISLTCNQFDLDKIIICMVKNCKICIRFNDNCIVQDMESENCEIALPNGFVLKIINGKCIYNGHDLVATMVTKEQFDQVSEQLKNLSIDTLTNGTSSNQTSTNTTETSTSITNISLTCNQFDLDKIIICMVKNCKICIRFNDNCIVQDMESENCEIALPNGFVLKIINGKCIYNSHDLVATMVTKEQFDQVSEQLKNLSIDTLTNGTSSNQTSTNTTETSTSITNISLTCNQFDLDKIIICMVKNCKICIRFNDNCIVQDMESENCEIALPNGFVLKIINGKCIYNSHDLVATMVTKEQFDQVSEQLKNLSIDTLTNGTSSNQTSTNTTETSTSITNISLTCNQFDLDKIIVCMVKNCKICIRFNDNCIVQDMESENCEIALPNGFVLKIINGKCIYNSHDLVATMVTKEQFDQISEQLKNLSIDTLTNGTSSNQTSTNTTETSTSITNISLTCNQFDLDKIIICMVKNCKICIRFNDNCIVQDMESENCEIALPNGFVLKIINGKCIYNSHDLVATMVTKEQFDQVSEQLKNLPIETETNGTSSNQTSTNTTETSTSITHIIQVQITNGTSVPDNSQGETSEEPTPDFPDSSEEVPSEEPKPEVTEEVPSEEPASEVPDNSEEETSEEPATEVPDNSEEETSEEPATEVPDNSEEETSEEPAPEVPDNSEEETSEEPATEVPDNSEEETSEEPATEVPHNLEEEISEEPAPEVPDNSEEETSEEPATEAPENSEEEISVEPATEVPDNSEEEVPEESTEQPILVTSGITQNPTRPETGNIDINHEINICPSNNGRDKRDTDAVSLILFQCFKKFIVKILAENSAFLNPSNCYNNMIMWLPYFTTQPQNAISLLLGNMRDKGCFDVKFASSVLEFGLEFIITCIQEHRELFENKCSTIKILSEKLNTVCV
ncbi:hypothetical protein ACFFRR_006353 [Megaselia abdita]